MVSEEGWVEALSQIYFWVKISENKNTYIQIENKESFKKNRAIFQLGHLSTFHSTTNGTFIQPHFK